jgi:hypothetical protein
MRWVNVVGLVLAFGFAVFLRNEIHVQKDRINELREELDLVHIYLPALIRSELAAQEDRLAKRIEGILVKK